MENFNFLLSEHFKSDWKHQAKMSVLLENFCFISLNEAFIPHLMGIRAFVTDQLKGGFDFRTAPLPYYCIIYTIDGICELNYDGFSYSLRKDSIVLLDLSKGFSICLSQTDEWSFSLFMIEGKNCSFFYQYFYKDRIAGFFLPPVSNIPSKIQSLQNLTKDSWSGDFPHFAAHKLLTDIMTALITEQGINPITAEMLPNHIIKSLTYIDSHYTQAFTLDDLSTFLNVSKFSLSHDFKKHMGKSVMDFVTEKRMAKAKELLSTTEDSIGQIGYCIGFSSDAHFISIFKKRVGITPLQYRKQHNLHSYNYILGD